MKESGHFSSFNSGFRRILIRSDVELPGQADNDRVEQFRNYMLKRMSYFHPRLATQVLAVASITLMITQQRTHTICNHKLIAIFVRLEKFKGPIRVQRCEILPFHWIRVTVQIEVIIVRPNFHVNISEQFTICECMRPFFEGSVNIDL